MTISGFQALKELGIEIDVYCASEIDEQAMQVGIERLSRMKSLGYFKLQFGTFMHAQALYHSYLTGGQGASWN